MLFSQRILQLTLCWCLCSSTLVFAEISRPCQQLIDEATRYSQEAAQQQVILSPNLSALAIKAIPPTATEALKYAQIRVELTGHYTPHLNTDTRAYLVLGLASQESKGIKADFSAALFSPNMQIVELQPFQVPELEQRTGTAAVCLRQSLRKHFFEQGPEALKIFGVAEIQLPNFIASQLLSSNTEFQLKVQQSQCVESTLDLQKISYAQLIHDIKMHSVDDNTR